MVISYRPFDIGEELGKGVGQGLGGAVSSYFQKQDEQKKADELTQALSQLSEEDLQNPAKIFSALSKRPEIAESILKSQTELGKVKAAREKPEGGLTGQPTPPQVAKAIQEVVRSNPQATSDELAIELDNAGVPRAFSNSFIENRRRQEEAKGKKEDTRESDIRKEVLPIKQKIVEKALAAQKGIENKQELLNQIEKGDLNDPTLAIILENLPFRLGQRFLSDDTVAYKAGLVEEFSDLRSIFQGQTRNAELDILQNKLADVYLNDSQKKKILKSRINALQADLIRAEAAEEVEDEQPNLGLLKFERAVNKKAKSKLEAIANRTYDELNQVFEEAENLKNHKLDPSRSEDKEVLIQLLKEAGGDKVKAREIARKKGYKI